MLKNLYIYLSIVLISAQTALCATAEQILIHDGKTRTYRLHVPQSYRPTEAAPLVFGLHGYGGTAIGLENNTGLSNIADREGFIAVYPNAMPWGSDQKQMWNAGGAYTGWWSGGVDDVGFISSLIESLSIEYTIDTGRVFVFGHSNGGFMAHHLGAQLPHKIAAIAPCAGLLAYSDFAPGPPVSVIHFHGDEDSAVPYTGLEGYGFTGAEEGALTWAGHNGCYLIPEIIRDDERALAQKWSSPIGAGDVVLYKLINHGHGIPNDSQVSAPELAWEFFENHTKPDFMQFIDENGPVHNVTQGFRYRNLVPATYFAEAGDILIVSPGLYNESAVLYDRDITIRSVDPNDPEITADTIIQGRSDRPALTITSNAVNCQLEGLTVTGGQTGLLSSSSGNIISCCHIIQNEGDGISASGDISFINCLVADNSGAGISMLSGEAQIVNCTITKNAGYAVTGSRSIIKNSILYNNETTPGTSQTDLFWSRITYSCVQGGAMGQGNISTNPLFIDLVYHLSLDSPCVDAGNPADHVGQEPTPNGDRINMGAYGGTMRATKTVSGWW